MGAVCQGESSPAPAAFVSGSGAKTITNARRAARATTEKEIVKFRFRFRLDRFLQALRFTLGTPLLCSSGAKTSSASPTSPPIWRRFVGKNRHRQSESMLFFRLEKSLSREAREPEIGRAGG